MRCIICDFSDGEAKSLYQGGLVEPKGSRGRKVILDKRTGDPICTVCQEFTEDIQWKKRAKENSDE